MEKVKIQMYKEETRLVIAIDNCPDTLAETLSKMMNAVLVEGLAPMEPEMDEIPALPDRNSSAKESTSVPEETPLEESPLPAMDSEKNQLPAYTLAGNYHGMTVSEAFGKDGLDSIAAISSEMENDETIRQELSACVSMYIFEHPFNSADELYQLFIKTEPLFRDEIKAALEENGVSSLDELYAVADQEEMESLLNVIKEKCI